MEMKAAGLIETGVSLDNPDFAAMARTIGLHGVRVTDPGDVEAGVRDVLAYPGPALLDAVTARTELSMPPKITLEQMKGFTLYMAKAIISGRGDEVLELGKTNAGLFGRFLWAVAEMLWQLFLFRSSRTGEDRHEKSLGSGTAISAMSCSTSSRGRCKRRL
jgi:hypothetical protein